MAIHWQVKFRSLRTNKLYAVNIYDENYTGVMPVQLTGGDVPFETQEDDDDDMFAPVRTQSGYLRIVDTGKDNSGNAFNWREFIPTTDTDRPVTLTDSSDNILWQGFMQAQDFGSRLYGNPQVREFPLQCALAVTSRYNNTYYKQDDVRNFAYLLKTILDSIPSMSRPNYIFVQGGEAAQEWLLKLIDWQLFFEEDVDWRATFWNTGFEGEPQPRYNLLECLKNMCRYWGWTARLFEGSMYLTCPDDLNVTGFLVLYHGQPGSNLDTLAEGTAAGDIMEDYQTVQFGDNIFVAKDNKDFQMRGPSKAVITSEMGAGGDIIECFSKGVLSRLHLMYTSDSHYEGIVTNIETSLIKAAGGTGADFSILRPGIYPSTTEYLPVIRIRQAYDGSVLASLESKKVHCFTDGYIVIKGQAYKDYNRLESADERWPEFGGKFMVMRIGIGITRFTAKWFVAGPFLGSSGPWSNLEWTCRGRLGGPGDTICVSPTDTSYSATIYRRIVTDGRVNGTECPMYGKIFIDFLGSEDGDLTTFDIANFAVEYYRSEKPWLYPDKELQDSHDYKSSNSNNVEMELSNDTFFATENNSVFGYGVVLNTDYSYFQGHSYDGGQLLQQPEQHLANRITDYWATSKRKLECKLRTDVAPHLSPITKGTIDGTLLYPISISRDWRNDVGEVKLMELPVVSQNT